MRKLLVALSLFNLSAFADDEIVRQAILKAQQQPVIVLQQQAPPPIVLQQQAPPVVIQQQAPPVILQQAPPPQIVLQQQAPPTIDLQQQAPIVIQQPRMVAVPTGGNTITLMAANTPVRESWGLFGLRKWTTRADGSVVRDGPLMGRQQVAPPTR